MPPYRELNHKIDLVDESQPPPKPCQYCMSTAELAKVKKQVEKMLQKGWIRPSVSPYGAPILFMHKKTGELCTCIDYHMLNANTCTDRFPIPCISELLDKLANATIFSTIDLVSAYHQVRIHLGHEHHTAFLMAEGLYEFTVLPFGLCNAPVRYLALHA